MTVSFPFSSGMALTTTLSGPEAGKTFWAVLRPHATASQMGHHSLLRGSGGTDCGHESLHDAKVATDDLGQGMRAVGGTRDIADNLEEVVILFVVHTHHKHGGVHRRGRDDDPFGSTLQVSPSLLHGREDTSGLHSTFSSSSSTPVDVSGISVLEEGDGLSMDNKLPILSLDCAIDLAMGRLILEHVVKVNERFIDGNDVHFARVKSSPGGQAPNVAKSIHSNLLHHSSCARLSVKLGGAER